MISDSLPHLRALWESTSFQLERLQANVTCVQQEEDGLACRTQPFYNLTFEPAQTPNFKGLGEDVVVVVVVIIYVFFFNLVFITNNSIVFWFF